MSSACVQVQIQGIPKYVYHRCSSCIFIISSSIRKNINNREWKHWKEDQWLIIFPPLRKSCLLILFRFSHTNVMFFMYCEYQFNSSSKNLSWVGIVNGFQICLQLFIWSKYQGRIVFGWLMGNGWWSWNQIVKHRNCSSWLSTTRVYITYLKELMILCYSKSSPDFVSTFIEP